VEVLAPDPGGAAVASFKDDRRTARAAALYVQPAATPNVNEAREVTLRGVGHWRGGARGAKADGKQQDGDGQGRGRIRRGHMIDSRGCPVVRIAADRRAQWVLVGAFTYTASQSFRLINVKKS